MTEERRDPRLTPLTRSMATALLGLASFLGGCLDSTAPEGGTPVVQVTYPAPGAVIFGERDSIRVHATDNVGVTQVRLWLSGPSFESLSLGDRAAPPWTWQLNTSSYPDGDYTLAAMARDAEGFAGWDTLSFRLTSLIGITSIEVRSLSDELGPPELEAHLFDSSGAFLGCSGARNGLAPVVNPRVRYTVDALFGKPPTGDLLVSFDEVVGRTVTLRLIEDDADPCPVRTDYPPAPGAAFSWDRPVGDTTLYLHPEFRSQTLAFDDVIHLTLSRTRKRD